MIFCLHGNVQLILKQRLNMRICFYVKNAKEINKGTVPLAELGVKVINDYKLEVELEQPIPYFYSC